MSYLADLLGIPKEERVKTIIGLGLLAWLKEQYEDYKYQRKKERREEDEYY